MATIKGVSEITGKVWKIEAALGDRVEDGDTVVILESMKMEVPVQSQTSGVVTAICVNEGDSVSEGDTVFILDT
ncbi:MAG: biotin/lipoyl-binding carrier protein [Proteobacteria bacterium]|nr:biotin/lipoyl-binding carrier protein [Pseudomonadota bacterium]